MAQLNALAHICPHLPELIKSEENITDESIYYTIQRVALPLQSSIFLCHWAGIFVHYAEIFTPVLTDEGLCFSLNVLNSQDMYTDQ